MYNTCMSLLKRGAFLDYKHMDAFNKADIFLEYKLYDLCLQRKSNFDFCTYSMDVLLNINNIIVASLTC